MQWREWRGVPLLLECVKLPDVSLELATALAAPDATSDETPEQAQQRILDEVWSTTGMKPAFQTIYEDATPHCEVKLTDIHALYVFRVVAPTGSEMDNGKVTEADIASKPVFWLAQPSPAQLCGQGRNLLVSWSIPTPPPSLGVDACKPTWIVTAREVNVPSVSKFGGSLSASVSNGQSQTVGTIGLGQSTLTSGFGGQSMGSPSKKSLKKGGATERSNQQGMTIVPGMGAVTVGAEPVWCEHMEEGATCTVIQGLARNRVYAITVQASLPRGDTAESEPVFHDTTIEAAKVEEIGVS